MRKPENHQSSTFRGKTNKCQGRCVPGSYRSAHRQTLKCTPALSSGPPISECGELAFFHSISLQGSVLQFHPRGNVMEQRERTCFSPEHEEQHRARDRSGCCSASSQVCDRQCRQRCAPGRAQQAQGSRVGTRAQGSVRAHGSWQCPGQRGAGGVCVRRLTDRHTDAQHTPRRQPICWRGVHVRAREWKGVAGWRAGGRGKV